MKLNDLESELSIKLTESAKFKETFKEILKKYTFFKKRSSELKNLLFYTKML